MAAEEGKKIETEPQIAGEKEDEKAILSVVHEEKPADKLAEVSDQEKPKLEDSIDRDDVLGKVAAEKKEALIKAWEESEKCKAQNKAQQKLSSIRAWENSKKAELEAELKKIEEDLEIKKAKYTEKMKNKIVAIHKRAEEKRAITEAKCREEILKAEEMAAKCRASGEPPKKLIGCFN